MQATQSPAREAAAALADVWGAACAHAGFSPGREAVLYAFPGSARDGEPWGTYADPGSDLAAIAPGHYPFTRADVEDTAETKDLHQVAVRTGAGSMELAGVLRHELEHARQRRDEADGAWASGILGEALKELGPVAWAGVYPTLPAERGANAAAGRFSRKKFGPPPVAVCGGVHHLMFVPVEDPPRHGELGLRALGVAALVPVTYARTIPSPAPDWSPPRRLRALVGAVAGEDRIDTYEELLDSREREMLFERFKTAVTLGETFAAPGRWDEARTVLRASESLALERLR